MNKQFIAASRENVPWAATTILELCERVEKLKAANDIMLDGLERVKCVSNCDLCYSKDHAINALAKANEVLK